MENYEKKWRKKRKKTENIRIEFNFRQHLTNCVREGKKVMLYMKKCHKSQHDILLINLLSLLA